MPKPSWLPNLERAAHMAMGAGARLLYLDLLLWRRERITQWPPKTNKLPVAYLDLAIEDAFLICTTAYWYKHGMVDDLTEYYPAARVKDMMSDIRDYYIGATLIEPVRWLLVALAVWRCCG